MSSNKKLKTCNVRGCFASSRDDPSTVFFPFPQLYQLMFEDWFKFANSETAPPRWICERHFDKNQYEDRIKAKLHRHAVPTLHPGLPTPVAKEAGAQKQSKKIVIPVTKEAGTEKQSKKVVIPVTKEAGTEKQSKKIVIPVTKEAGTEKQSKKIVITRKTKKGKVVSVGAPENSCSRLWSNPNSVPKTFGIGQYIPPKEAPPNFTQNLDRYGQEDDDVFKSPKNVNSPVIFRTADGIVIPRKVNRAPPNFIQTLNKYDPSNSAKNHSESEPSPPKVKRLSKKSKEASDSSETLDVNRNMEFYKKLGDSLPHELPISTKFKQALEELEEASKKGSFTPVSAPNMNISGGLNSTLSTSHTQNLGSHVTNQSPPKSTTLVLKPSSKKVDLNIDKSSFQTTLKLRPKIITVKPKVQAGKQKAKSKLRKPSFWKNFMTPDGRKLVSAPNPSAEFFPKILYGTPKNLSEENSVAVPNASPVKNGGMKIPDSSRLVKVDPKCVPDFLKKLLAAQGNASKASIPDKTRLVKVDPKSVSESVKDMLQGKGNQVTHKTKEIGSIEKTTDDADLGISMVQGQENKNVIFVKTTNSNVLKTSQKVVSAEMNGGTDSSELIPDKSRLVKIDLKSGPAFVKMKAQGLVNVDTQILKSRPIEPSALEEKNDTDSKNARSQDYYVDNDFTHHHGDDDEDDDACSLESIESLHDSDVEQQNNSPLRVVQHFKIKQSKKQLKIVPLPPKAKLKNKSSRGLTGTPEQQSAPSKSQVNDDDDVIFLGSVASSSKTSKASSHILEPALMEKSEKNPKTVSDTTDKTQPKDTTSKDSPGAVIHQQPTPPDKGQSKKLDGTVQKNNSDSTDLKSAEVPSVDQTTKSTEIHLTKNQPSLVQTPKTPVPGTATSDIPAGIPKQMVLVKVDPKSIPNHIKIMVEGKGNIAPSVGKPAKSPLANQIQRQNLAELPGMASDDHGYSKADQSAIKQRDQLAELWDAYEKSKNDFNSCLADHVSFLKRRLQSKDKMSPELEDTVLKFITKPRTYSKKTNPENSALRNTSLGTDNDDVICLEPAAISSQMYNSSGAIRSAVLERYKEKLQTLLQIPSNTELKTKDSSDSTRSEIGSSATGVNYSNPNTVESSVERPGRKVPTILRRSKNVMQSKSGGRPNTLEHLSIGQDSIMNQAAESISNLEDLTSRRVINDLVESSKTRALTSKEQIEGANLREVEVFTMKHMTSCYVHLVDVLEQETIIDKYLSPSQKKQLAAKRVTPKRKGRSNHKKSNVCKCDLTDGPTPAVSSKRRKNKTKKGGPSSETFKTPTNEFESQISIAESFQQVDMTKLYGGFTLLQHTINVFESSPLSTVYTYLFTGTSMVQSSIDPSFKPGFLYTPQTKEVQVDGNAAVFVSSELVSRLKNAISGLRFVLEEQMKPLVGTQRGKLNKRQCYELASVLEWIKSGVEVVEAALRMITSKNPIDPEELKANAIKKFPCILKMTSHCVQKMGLQKGLNPSDPLLLIKSKDTLKEAIPLGVKDPDSQLTATQTKPIDPSLPQSLLYVMLIGEDTVFETTYVRRSKHRSYLVIVQLSYNSDAKTDLESAERQPTNNAPSNGKNDDCIVDSSTSKTTNDANPYASTPNDSDPATSDKGGDASAEQAPNALAEKTDLWKAYLEYKNKMKAEPCESGHDVMSFLRRWVKCKIPELQEAAVKFMGCAESPSSEVGKRKVIRLLGPPVVKNIVSKQTVNSTKTSNETTDKTQNDASYLHMKSPVDTDEGPDACHQQTVKPTTASQTSTESCVRVDVTRLFGGFAMLVHAASNLSIGGVTFTTLSVLKVAAAILGSFANENVALLSISDFLDSPPTHISKEKMTNKKASLVYIERGEVTKISESLIRMRSAISRLSYPSVRTKAFYELRLVVKELRTFLSYVKDRIPPTVKYNLCVFPEELLSRSAVVRVIIPEEPKKAQRLDVGLSAVMLAFSWIHIVDVHHDKLVMDLVTLLSRRSSEGLPFLTKKKPKQVAIQVQRKVRIIRPEPTPLIALIPVLPESLPTPRITPTPLIVPIPALPEPPAKLDFDKSKVIKTYSCSRANQVPNSETPQGLVGSKESLKPRTPILAEKDISNANGSTDFKVTSPLHSPLESSAPPESTNVGNETGTAAGRPSVSAVDSLDASKATNLEELNGTRNSPKSNVLSSATSFKDLPDAPDAEGSAVSLGSSPSSTLLQGTCKMVEMPCEREQSAIVDSQLECAPQKTSHPPEDIVECGSAGTAKSLEDGSRRPVSVANSDKPSACKDSNDVADEFQFRESTISNITSDTGSSSNPSVPVLTSISSRCTTEGISLETSSESQKSSEVTKDSTQTHKRPNDPTDVENEAPMPKVKKTSSDHL